MESGRRFQTRMLATAALTSLASTVLVAVYLLALLSLTRELWVAFLEITVAWFTLLLVVSHRVQMRAYSPISSCLDARLRGDADQETLLAGFAALIDLPRYTVVNGYSLWLAGGVLVSLTMKGVFPDFRWVDALVMFSAAASGGALSVLLVAFLVKRALEPLRAVLGSEIEDSEARTAAIRRLPLVWKLQASVVVTAAVPVVFAVLIAHSQSAQPLADFVAAGQQVWLERNAPRLVRDVRGEVLQTVRSEAQLSESVEHVFVMDAVSGLVIDGEVGLMPDAVRGAVAAAPDGGHSLSAGFVTSWRMIPESGDVLVSALPWDAVSKQLVGIRGVLAAVLVSALTIAFGVAWLVARDLGRSIAAIRSDAERIASGDLTRGTVLESEDELGELSLTFERMRDALRATAGRAAAAADRLDASSGEMASLGGAVAQATAEQVQGIRRARESTDAVREQVGGIADSAQALNVSVEESSSSIARAGSHG